MDDPISFVMPAHSRAYVRAIKAPNTESFDVLQIMRAFMDTAGSDKWAYWGMDETASPRVDLSGHSRNLTPVSTDPGYAAGKISNAIKIGPGQNMVVAEAPDTTNGVTLLLWFKFVSGGDYDGGTLYFGYDGDGSDLSAIIFSDAAPGHLVSVGAYGEDLLPTPVNRVNLISSMIYTPDEWHLVIITVDPVEGCKVRLDNAVILSDPTALALYPCTSGESVINVDINGTCFVEVDECCMLERAFTAAECTDAWNGGAGKRLA